MICINKNFFCIFLLLCLIVVITLPENSDATTKKILVTGNSKIRGLVFLIDDNFRGLIGDWIYIETGQHVLKVKHGKAYQKTLMDIREKSAKIIQSEIIDGYSISRWAKPTMAAHGSNYVINISNPISQGPGGPSPLRPKLKMHRSLGSLIIHVTSVPKGAKLYIAYPNGKRRKGKTNQDIKVFYYKNTKNLMLIVRKENYVNRSENIFPPFPERYTSVLNLHPVPSH